MLIRIVRKVVRSTGNLLLQINKQLADHKFKKKSDIPGLDYFETPTGKYYMPEDTEQDDVAIAIKNGWLYDQAIIEEATKFIRPGTIIIDAGANFGQMSIAFSRLSENTTVYSLEAQKMIYEILERNIRANKIENIRTFYNAVHDKDNIELKFPVPDMVRFTSYGSYGIDPAGKTGNPVKSITIDSLPIDKPVSFIKIDVQGSDLAALRGAENTIRKYRMPIVFEYEELFQEQFKTCFQDYVDFVNHIGYRFVKTIQKNNYLIAPNN